MNAYQKLIAVMRCLATADGEVRKLKKIAAETGLPQSTAHSILKTLIDESWAAVDDGGYALSVGFTETFRKEVMATVGTLLDLHEVTRALKALDKRKRRVEKENAAIKTFISNRGDKTCRSEKPENLN